MFSCTGSMLTFEFLGFFDSLACFRVAAQDFFSAYIFTINGASVLFLFLKNPAKDIAEHLAGREQEHDTQCDGNKTEAFHGFCLL